MNSTIKYGNFQGYVIADIPLNVRSGPGTGYTKVGKLYLNDKVTITAEDSGWYRIGDNRWASAEWIAKGNPIPTYTPSQEEIDYYQNIPNYGEVDNSIYEGVDWEAALEQVFLGEWSGVSNLPGTAGEIVLSATGFDLYKDVGDLIYYLTHWENTWEDYTKVGITIIATLPLIGMIKNADEAYLVGKNLTKASDAKKFFKHASKIDIIKLAKKFDGHAFSKHVGKTEQQLLALRKGTGSISTFYNQGLAEEAIENALKDKSNQKDIIGWLNSDRNINLDLNYISNKAVGYGYFEGENIAKATNKVRVALKKDGNGGFYIITAFPKQ